MSAKFVADVAVVDVEKRRAPQKHYVYVVNVSWSDGSTTTIYRRYSVFFELHIRLMEEFPAEAGVDGGTRTIPFLPGKKMFGRSHTQQVALSRTKLLEEYLKALIEMPSKISRCATTLGFFESTSLDSKPLSAEEKLDQLGVAKTRYVAMSDFDRPKAGQIALRIGNVVEVRERNENGWWLVTTSAGDEGWVPGSYLQAVLPPPARNPRSERSERQSVFADVAAKTPAIAAAPAGPKAPRVGGANGKLPGVARGGGAAASMMSATTVKKKTPSPGDTLYVVESMQRTDDSGLDCPIGSRVTLIELSDSGWWYVKAGSEQGWFPSDFLSLTPLAGAGRSALSVTTIATNPLLEESSFESVTISPPMGAVIAPAAKNLSGAGARKESVAAGLPRTATTTAAAAAAAASTMSSKASAVAAPTLISSPMATVAAAAPLAALAEKLAGPRKHAAMAYVATSEGELSLSQGEAVTVVETGDSGWVFARKADGAEGWVSQDFLED